MKGIVYSALLNHNKQALKRNYQQPAVHIQMLGIGLSEENYKKGSVFVFLVSKALEVTFPSTMRYVKKE